MPDPFDVLLDGEQAGTVEGAALDLSYECSRRFDDVGSAVVDLTLDGLLGQSPATAASSLPSCRIRPEAEPPEPDAEDSGQSDR